MEYNAISQNTSFEIKAGSQILGKLTYGNWFKFNAEMEIAGEKYDVEPKGFWKKNIEIKNDAEIIADIKMNWDGDLIIRMKSSGKEEKFVLKHSGFIKEKFILTNDQNEDLLIFKASYRWIDMIYNYHITSSENFEAIPDKTLLLFITLYAANYFMWISASI